MARALAGRRDRGRAARAARARAAPARATGCRPRRSSPRRSASRGERCGWRSSASRATARSSAARAAAPSSAGSRSAPRSARASRCSSPTPRWRAGRASGSASATCRSSRRGRPATSPRRSGCAAGRRAPLIQRTLLADGTVAAHMRDIVHPDVELPPPEEVRAAIEVGEDGARRPASSGGSRSRSRGPRCGPRLVEPGSRLGEAIGATRVTAALELTELMHLAGGQAVQYSIERLRARARSTCT